MGEGVPGRQRVGGKEGKCVPRHGTHGSSWSCPSRYLSECDEWLGGDERARGNDWTLHPFLIQKRCRGHYEECGDVEKQLFGKVNSSTGHFRAHLDHWRNAREWEICLWCLPVCIHAVRSVVSSARSRSVALLYSPHRLSPGASHLHTTPGAPWLTPRCPTHYLTEADNIPPRQVDGDSYQKESSQR